MLNTGRNLRWERSRYSPIPTEGKDLIFEKQSLNFIPKAYHCSIKMLLKRVSTCNSCLLWASLHHQSWNRTAKLSGTVNYSSFRFQYFEPGEFEWYFGKRQCFGLLFVTVNWNIGHFSINGKRRNPDWTFRSTRITISLEYCTCSEAKTPPRQKILAIIWISLNPALFFLEVALSHSLPSFLLHLEWLFIVAITWTVEVLLSNCYWP